MKTVLGVLLLFISSYANAYVIADDTGKQVWKFNDIGGTVTNSQLVEISESVDVTFGIYSAGNPGSKVGFFNDINILEWSRLEWDSVTHIVDILYSINGISFSSIFSGFTDETQFGFWFNDGTDDFYSESYLNGSGEDRLVTLDITSDAYVLAWDVNGDSLFGEYIVFADDMIGYANRISNAPAIFLFIIGFIGIGFITMTRKKKTDDIRNLSNQDLLFLATEK